MSHPRDSRLILAYKTAHSYNYKRDITESELVLFPVWLAIGLGSVGNHLNIRNYGGFFLV